MVSLERLTYEPNMATTQFATLRQVLKQYWGFDEFLPLQQEAMDCALRGRDSLVVLPTGGGKSLCFQAPAMCRDGLAVVVSPLISLMTDQVQALHSCGIPAACVNSMVALDQRRRVADAARAGTLRLLYIAPERLLTPRTLEFLHALDVSLFAIDEAHCISMWGHDFRPEYRGLSRLKEEFPGVGVHAYTATATDRVREDIVNQLRLEDPAVLIGSFDRPNLVYKLQRRRHGLKQICSVLDRHLGESGLVYCITRAEVDNTSQALNELGYKTLPYHAGMADDDRRRNQSAFIEERVDTIVATVAFGMGIDKSNVRYVVHAGMPKSLEAYQQETGRAGRDGLEAECCVFYSGADFRVWRKILEETESEGRQGALDSLEAMYSFCTGVQCRHRALVEYFGQTYHQDACHACDVCLGDLDLVDDALVVGQKILSCVLRVKERFGGDYVSLVLAGSEDQRVRQNGHRELSTWGILKDENRRAIRGWIEQLVGQGYLNKVGEYHVLQVTEAGRSVLRGEQTPKLLRPATQRNRRAAASEDSWEGVDRGLFDQLRELRREFAFAHQVPAYVIFSDAALRDMARCRPTTPAGFSAIRGVGQKKGEDFGVVFTERIREYCALHGIETDRAATEAAVPASRLDDSGPSRSALASFRYFDAGHSIDEVARHMGRARSTTVGYLQAYIRHRHLTDATRWVAPEIIAQVEHAAARHDTRGLKPIFDELAGRVSYEQIRIVMACRAQRQ
jgi:ATP-dependent DNA helicase RecQ